MRLYSLWTLSTFYKFLWDRFVFRVVLLYDLLGFGSTSGDLRIHTRLVFELRFNWNHRSILIGGLLLLYTFGLVI